MARVAHNIIDLMGERFSRLTVIDRAANLPDGRTQWKCVCDCGQTKQIRGSDLRQGNTKSCGCLLQEFYKTIPKGELSPFWKGGHTDKNGYKVSGNNKHGSRLLHRRIMEDSLGRELTPQETVHHINGVRNDNRPENLELWSSKHCKGQRVKDKVNFALEILELYAPERLKKG